ncbi:hypothetical protein [Thauera sp. WB-2]|uniref:hypothetical protein n=1 Tax=Thauera sp. WB-2 TaxID=2897772 RepID=UPI0022DDF625|nr:hypothetical protein [Thauera sp. WB-2]WBL64755.1 hypothetical protein LQF09_02705 [Thauera sp. WB-2]
MHLSVKGKSAPLHSRFAFYRTLRRITNPVMAYRLSRGASTALDNAKTLAVVAGGAVAIHAVLNVAGPI